VTSLLRINRLRELRARIRDVAATRLAAGLARERAAADEESRARAALRAFLERSARDLEICGATDLLLLEAERMRRDDGLTAATSQRQERSRERAALEEGLKQREQELFVSERVLERARGEVGREQRRHEQAASDDLCGSRAARSR
jgi:hypothetical protein